MGEHKEDNFLGFEDLFLGKIFNNPMENRTAATNSDEFVLRRAKVYKLKSGDDKNSDCRIQVQIVPEMSNMPDEDLEYLPEYPPFYEGTFHPYKKGEYVWVVCTPDCQQGYILGKSHIFPITDEIGKAVCYNFNSIKEYFSGRKVLSSSFKFENIVITNCFQNKDDNGKITGGLCEGYDKVTGDWFVLNSTGTMLFVQGGEIFLRAGSPSKEGEEKKSWSSISITPDSIEINSPKVKINAPLVEINDGTFPVLTGNGGRDIGTLGQAFIPGGNKKLFDFHNKTKKGLWIGIPSN